MDVLVSRSKWQGPFDVGASGEYLNIALLANDFAESVANAHSNGANQASVADVKVLEPQA